MFVSFKGHGPYCNVIRGLSGSKVVFLHYVPTGTFRKKMLFNINVF